MFKDRNEELRRLEEALLEEEELQTPDPVEEAPEDEDLLTDEILDELLEDTTPVPGNVPYQNFSNDYGQAYNADNADVDLEEYSEAVRQPKKDHSGLVILVCLLALGVLGMLIFLMLRQGGFL